MYNNRSMFEMFVNGSEMLLNDFEGSLKGTLKRNLKRNLQGALNGAFKGTFKGKFERQLLLVN